jgi:Rad3-related DNA helicase
VSLGTVDERILFLEDFLEQKIDELHDLGDVIIQAKGKWLKHKDIQEELAIARKEKVTVASVERLARRNRNEEGVHGMRLWKDLEEAEQAEKALNTEIRAIQARMSALQSVSNHINKAT